MAQRTVVHSPPISNRSDAAAMGSRSFVQLFAVAVFAIHSALSISMMVLVPDLAQTPVIWVLWLVVATIATAAFITGRRIHLASQEA